MPASIGASIALNISDIPFDALVGSIKVGIVDGEIVLNPGLEQREKSTLDLTVSATQDKICMIEAGACEVPDDKMLEAIKVAHTEIKKLCDFIKAIREEVGKEKAKYKSFAVPEELVEFVESMKDSYEKGTVHKGVIGSGDIWNCEKDKIMYLNQKHDVVCEEMEGIAVYTVAKNYNIPVVGIRVISDNEMLAEEYDRNLGLECQKFVYEIVKKMLEVRN